MSRARWVLLLLGLAGCSGEGFPETTGGGPLTGGGAAGGSGAGGATNGGGPDGGSPAQDCSALDDACGEGQWSEGRCQRVPREDGAPCDDGLACTEGDRCQGGACLPVAPFECAVAVPCHVATCNTDTGLCELVPGLDGSTCDDGDHCTFLERCQAGVCGGGEAVPIPDDGEFCRKVVCDPRVGLRDAPDNLGAECRDPEPCAEYRCAADDDNGWGYCSYFPINEGLACDDANDCTLNNVCSDGYCAGEYAELGAPCEDGISCSVGDWCIDGSCQAGPEQCAPSSELCVRTACSGSSPFVGCVSYPDWGTPCEEPSPCRGEGACENGLCKNGPPLNDGGACDDRRACTATDTCSAGACEGVAITACASGDGCCPAGCDAGGDSDCGATLYMASTQGLPGFFAFDLETEAWTALPDPPSAPRSRLATRDGRVFVLAEDGNVYGFDPASVAWTLEKAGPSWSVGAPSAGGEALIALQDGEYLLKLGSYLYRSVGQSWITLTWAEYATNAIAIDEPSGDVLFRWAYGLFVGRFEVATNNGLYVWADGPSALVGPSRFGSLWQGTFYTALLPPSPAIVAIEPGINNWAPTNLTTADPDPSSDLDPATGLIYLGPSDSGAAFEVFDPVGMTLSPLPSPPPIPDGYLSSVVVVRAPSAP